MNLQDTRNSRNEGGENGDYIDWIGRAAEGREDGVIRRVFIRQQLTCMWGRNHVRIARHPQQGHGDSQTVWT